MKSRWFRVENTVNTLLSISLTDSPANVSFTLKKVENSSSDSNSDSNNDNYHASHASASDSASDSDSGRVRGCT